MSRGKKMALEAQKKNAESTASRKSSDTSTSVRLACNNGGSGSSSSSNGVNNNHHQHHHDNNINNINNNINNGMLSSSGHHSKGPGKSPVSPYSIKKSSNHSRSDLEVNLIRDGGNGSLSNSSINNITAFGATSNRSMGNPSLRRQLLPNKFQMSQVVKRGTISHGASAELRNSFRGQPATTNKITSGVDASRCKRSALSASGEGSLGPSEVDTISHDRSRPRRFVEGASSFENPPDLSLDSHGAFSQFSVCSRNEWQYGGNDQNSRMSQESIDRQSTGKNSNATRDELSEITMRDLRDESSRDTPVQTPPPVTPKLTETAFRAQDDALLQAAERERNASLSEMTAGFIDGFDAEWAVQSKRTDGACAATLRVLKEQLAEEEGIKNLARSTWEFQMNKISKDTARLQDNLQSTLEEGELCEAQLKRFRGTASELNASVDGDELQQLMATLLHTARLVRREKDLRMTDQLSGLIDTVRCIICQDRPRSVVCSPCNHMCMCLPCMKNLVQRKCPMCRTKIEKHIKVNLNEGSISL